VAAELRARAAADSARDIDALLDDQFDAVLKELDTKWLWAEEDSRRAELREFDDLLLEDELDAAVGAAALLQYGATATATATPADAAQTLPHRRRRPRPAATSASATADEEAGHQTQSRALAKLTGPRQHAPDDVQGRLKGPPMPMSIVMGLMACNLLWFSLYDGWGTLGSSW